MEPAQIRVRVRQMDTTRLLEQDQVWADLRPLGEAIVPYLAELYEAAKKWQGRGAAVYHSIFYARTNETAFQLGLKACNDKAIVVRYHACALLAYSLRKDALFALEGLRNHDDPKTRADALAAIEAIRRQNHHLFIDRDATGHSYWVVNPEDDPVLEREVVGGRRRASVRGVRQGDVVWPPDWQQEAIDAALPYVGSDDRLHILAGDPKDSISGTAIAGHLFAEGDKLMIIYDKSGRPDVYPWPLLSGPVLRIELLRPKKRRVLLFSAPGWEPPATAT